MKSITRFILIAVAFLSAALFTEAAAAPQHEEGAAHKLVKKHSHKKHKHGTH